MTEPPFEQDVPVSEYGAWRKQKWLADAEARSAWAQEASLRAYGQSEDRRRTQAGQQGILGHMSPTERGAEVQGRAATIGSEWGQTRALERNGGAFTHHLSGPAPARVSLVGQGAPPGYQRDENPLVRRSRENR